MTQLQHLNSGGWYYEDQVYIASLPEFGPYTLHTQQFSIWKAFTKCSKVLGILTGLSSQDKQLPQWHRWTMAGSAEQLTTIAIQYLFRKQSRTA